MMNKSEKEKIALVIEGGGFRSVFTAGVLDSFLVNKFNPFDIYFAVSSGSMCLSYYLGDQYKIVFNMMKDVSNDEKFLSYTHAFSEEGYMDLKYLAEYAKKHSPLDRGKVKDSIKNKIFYLVATDVQNGKPVYLRPNKGNFYRCMRATSSLPFFTKGKCKIDGVNLMDGAWSDPIPVKTAVNLGAKKIIVIRTLPLGHRLDGLSYLGLAAGYWWINNSRMSRQFFEEHNYYNEAVDFLEKDHPNLQIYQICPDNFLKTGLFSGGEECLIRDYHFGMEKGIDFLRDHLDFF